MKIKLNHIFFLVAVSVLIACLWIGCGESDPAGKADGDSSSDDDDSSAWTQEVVDLNQSAGLFSSLAVGLDGTVHISYYDGSNGSLKYASHVFGSWSQETVDVPLGDQFNSTYSDFNTAIALDSLGNPHISYADLQQNVIMYASKENNIWEVLPVAQSEVYFSKSNDIAIDSGDVPHICYCGAPEPEITTACIVHAYYQNDNFTRECARNEDNCGSCSISLDSLNRVHMAYFDTYSSELKYVTNSSGVWESTAISTGGPAYYGHIQLDMTGKAYVSFFNK